MNEMNLEILLYWITERMNIWYRRDAGVSRDEWTDDDILKRLSFCNVHRELDRGTISNKVLIRKCWDHPYYPVMAVAARMTNISTSLDLMTKSGAITPKRFNLQTYLDALLESRAMGNKIFNSAYMTLIQNVKGDRIELLFEHLFNYVKEDSKKILETIREGDNQEIFTSMRRKYLGDFLTQQVLIDMAHTPLMAHTTYREDFTVLGPGSTRGMVKLFGDTEDWYDKLVLLQQIVNDRVDNLHPLYAKNGITMHDLQNCLCEFDKYTRVLEDPKRRLKKYPKTS